MESNISINIDRMWSTLMDMAKIGPGIAGGNNRQTLTHEDGEARHLFQKWCNDASLEMNVDELGSMFFLRKGIDNELKPVVIGSHLDTQPTGGKYDGVLGVLAGLEIIRTLNDLDIKTKRPIMIVNWTNEEGCRFAPALMASSGFVGTLKVNEILNTKDLDGKVFKDELAKIGWNGKEKVGSQKMHCYFELHIEQGPILEKENIDIKVLKTNQGRTSSIRKLFETTSKTSDRTRGLKRLENNTPKKDRNKSTPVSTKTKRRKRMSKKDVKSCAQPSTVNESTDTDMSIV